MKEFGWTDNLPQSYHGIILKCIQDILPLDGSPILDIGCGNGYVVNTLIKKGYNAYGIDASYKGVEIANRSNNGRFYVNDIASARLPEEIQHIPFRTIISTEVIEHLYSPGTYVKLVRTILERNGGGTFIISTPYHGYLKNLLIAVFNRFDYHFSALWEGGHIKFWSRATLTRLLHGEGFRKITFRGVGRFPYCWKHMVLRAII